MRGKITSLGAHLLQRTPGPDGGGEQPPSKVVAKVHKDLGVLTDVVGYTPGHECWDPSRHS